MVCVIFELPNCETRKTTGPVGVSLMEVAISNGIPGIDAICGGSASCGTCHVQVAENWLHRLTAPEALEVDLLDSLTSRQVSSRLACQITLSEALDGLSVKIPDP
jgi:ferredoxin, 2Fe-2S